MDEEQHKRFQTAVERKKAQSKAAADHATPSDNNGESAIPEEQQSLIERARPQDTRDPRAKNEGHGKKTADKWNQ
jgi:hypothetical protein